MQRYQPGPKAVIMSLVLLGVVSLIPVATYFAAPWIGGSSGLAQSLPSHPLMQFNNITELHKYLFTTQCNQTVRPLYATNFSGSAAPTTLSTSQATDTASLSSSTGTSVGPAYSQTNDQVPGVDELDTVKTDGTYIYTVTNNTVAIVLAYPATQSRLLTTLSFNGSIQGMFIFENHLIVITQEPVYNIGPIPIGLASATVTTGIAAPGGIVVPYRLFTLPTTSLWSFDISNHSKPVLTTSLVVNGTLTGARLIGNYAYLIASTQVYCDGPLVIPEPVLNSVTVPVMVSEIYHSDIQETSHSFTSIASLDISKSNAEPTVKILTLGSDNTMYVSTRDIFLTQNIWNVTQATAIHRIHIDNGTIDYQASGTVSGYPLNQFSMDQDNNGYFRIATINYGWWCPGEGVMIACRSGSNGNIGTNLYVLDNSLRLYGKLEGLAPGEQFYAARFIGNRAYLVTFQRIDPLFVVGLNDPAHPKVLGELQINGVSDYLQPYDENHLIGIGFDTRNVTWENAALMQGLKISLFDVTNPSNPVETSRFIVGDRGTSSPATSEHKAVLFDSSLNLLVIPVEIFKAQIYSNSSLWYPSNPVWQGAYVFKITTNNGIIFRGGITHLTSNETPSWNNQASFVTRSLYIGNTLYTISNSMVKMNSLDDLHEINTVTL